MPGSPSDLNLGPGARESERPRGRETERENEGERLARNVLKSICLLEPGERGCPKVILHTTLRNGAG